MPQSYLVYSVVYVNQLLHNWFDDMIFSKYSLIYITSIRGLQLPISAVMLTLPFDLITNCVDVMFILGKPVELQAMLFYM